MSQEFEELYGELSGADVRDEIVRLSVVLKSTEDEKKELMKGFTDIINHTKKKINYLVDLIKAKVEPTSSEDDDISLFGRSQ